MRRLCADPMRVLCGNDCEDLNHLFRDCLLPTQIWAYLQIDPSRNTKSIFIWLGYLEVAMVFVFGIWYIWKWRCSFVFETDLKYSTNPENFIKNQVRIWEVSLNPPPPPKDSLTIGVSWSKPPVGVLELNTDCSLDSSSGVLSAGGVVRDYRGD